MSILVKCALCSASAEESRLAETPHLAHIRSFARNGGYSGQQNLPAIQFARPKSRGNAPSARGGRPHPHPGRLGHLRTGRRQRPGARRVPQAHRRLEPERHHSAPDRLHRAVAAASRSSASWCPAKCPSSTSAWIGQLVHAIFTQHIQQGRPVLEHVLDGPVEELAPRELLICGSRRCGWKGPRPFSDMLDEKLRAAGLTPGQVRVTHASCFGACNAAEAGQFSHLLVRPDKVLYRVKDEAELDEIIRQHLVGGRAGRAFGSAGQNDRPEILGTLRRRGLLQSPKPRGPADTMA